MEDFHYFIDTFIQKERRERWRFFTTRSWGQFTSEFRNLSKSLNERCTLIENNAFEIANQIIADLQITHGLYVDPYHPYTPMRPIDLCQVIDNSLLLCRSKKIAFYFHHEGWIWICQEVR